MDKSFLSTEIVSNIHELIGDMHSYNLDVQSNEIFLMGSEEYIGGTGEAQNEPGVDFSMANRFIRNLSILSKKSDDPILIHMKSCGGDWWEGMAIYQALKACPNKTVILNYAHARSMSSIIFQAADKRVMMPHSIFMFHEGTLGFEGTPKMFRSELEQENKYRNLMLDIYIGSMKKSGKMKNKSKAQVKAWLLEQMDRKEDVYLSAEESVEYGFADFIFGKNDVYDWSQLIEF